MRDFSSKLLHWYAIHKRDLPWRHTKDPYRIWVSEVILQQTQVRQGIGYYQRFTRTFPDIGSLDRASIEEIMKLWQGLGYYHRAINMKKTARRLVEEHGGHFPRSHDDIIRLNGIGPYIAAAIASFAFDLPYPVVDGNVKRVISRLFALGTSNNASFEKDILKKAREILSPDDPGLHNQAIMEFGALQCTPAAPDCPGCIFNDRCAAYRINKVNDFPPRKKRPVQVKRHLHFLVFQTEQHVLIRKRTGQDIWPQLYDFPGVETPIHRPAGTVRKMAVEHFNLSAECTVFKEVSEPYVHKLSHQTILGRFYVIDGIPDHYKEFPDILMVPIESLGDYGVPKLIRQFMESHFKLRE